MNRLQMNRLQMDRQIDRQIYRQIYKSIDIQMDRYIDGQIYRWIDIQKDRYIDGQINKWVYMDRGLNIPTLSQKTLITGYPCTEQFKMASFPQSFIKIDLIHTLYNMAK